MEDMNVTTDMGLLGMAQAMEDIFWSQLDTFKKTGKGLTPNSVFVVCFATLSKKVRAKMDSEGVSDIFSDFVSPDNCNWYDDFCDLIIWNGRDSYEKFLINPSSAIHLAETMSQTPGFDGDVNPLRSI